MNAPTLFDSVPAVRNGDPQTSRDAAKANPVGRSKLRWQILATLARRSDNSGATDYELAWFLDMPHMRGTVAKRRKDLEDAGFVGALYLPDGRQRTRKTDTGSQAIVWGLTPAGRALAEKGMP